MDKYAKSITSFLVGMALIIFIYGIIAIYVHPCADDPNYTFPEFLKNTLTSISTILSANLAVIVGLASFKNGNDSGTTARYEKLFKPAELLKGITDADNFKIICAYLYLVSLVAVAILFGLNQFDPRDLNPIIPQFVQTLIGLIVAALAVRLGVNTGS